MVELLGGVLLLSTSKIKNGIFSLFEASILFGTRWQVSYLLNSHNTQKNPNFIERYSQF